MKYLHQIVLVCGFSGARNLFRSNALGAKVTANPDRAGVRELLRNNFRAPVLCKASPLKYLHLIATAGAVLLLNRTPLFAEIKIVVEHNDNGAATGQFKFKNVPAPSKTNAATKAKFTIAEGDRDDNGGELDVLHDGKLPVEEDQPDANFFFDAGTKGGRLLIDLGSVIAIKQVNTYSWHPNTRGPQVYKLYASDGAATQFQPIPAKGADPQTNGWKLLANVDTRPKSGDSGGQYGVSIADSESALGHYRYLLFEMVRTEADDDFGNTFYSEIDVIEHK